MILHKLTAAVFRAKAVNRFATQTWLESQTHVKRALGIAAITLISAQVAAVEGNPRVNQLGYLPGSDKIATYASSSNSPLNWRLEKNGQTIASGTTTPKGFDSASGESVHQIDFTSVDVIDNSLRLVVGGDQSYPFDIAPNVFSGVAYDSIKYFYHNRSGIEIRTEFTGGGLGSFGNDAKWARPAGHLNQGVNQGDFGVPCWPGTCNYSLDVPYGWYDAGDHGKYVVNGGISVFKLANMYETAQHLRGTEARFADGTLNIPESGNGVPDILDEIRWQMRFMLAMQVPDGRDKAGMVHHKMHDATWTGIPLYPHQDDRARYLVPPSTAATLNLAATGAQCARLWREIDPAFANQCETAAIKAWDAAKQHSNITLPDAPYNSGGGSYGDTSLADEFFWAAAELYITTGDARYLGDINLSAIGVTDYSWQQVQLAGVMSLATVPTPHTDNLRAQARQKLIEIANQRLSVVRDEGYLTPITSSEYVWGSNNMIANALTILGIAYDLTGNDEYAQAVGYGVNYLFGQNPLSNSYITWHGEKTTQQPHHRVWAGAKDSAFPWAIPGAFAGGPNVGLEDDLSRNALDGCQSRPQTCYIDDIGAWSTNEITINWNSALAWVLAFYDDYAQADSGDPTVELTSPFAGQNFLPGEVVTASASAQDADGFVQSVSFALNGVSVATDNTEPYSVELTSLADGAYSLVAEVTDNDGKRAVSAAVPFSVGEVINLPPEASFSVSVNHLSASFDASASRDADGEITQYLWRFGDGQTASGVQVTHEYETADQFNVELEVVDNQGANDFADAVITTTVPPVVSLSCSIASFDIWNNGAIVRDVKVTNISQHTVNGWQVVLKSSSQVAVVDAWGATVTGSGQQLTASYAQSLPPGASAVFTAHISHDGQFTGMTCDTGGGDSGNKLDAFIEAESYTLMQGVQTENTSDVGGGLNVGWIDTFDWMVFPVLNVPETGSYIVEYRVASPNSGGKIQLEARGGNSVFGQIDVPNTGNWQAWQTISHTVTLPAGPVEIAIAAKAGGFNINWFRIRSAD